MTDNKKTISSKIGEWFSSLGFGVRTKLISLFIAIKIVPLVLLALVAWRQALHLGDDLRERTAEIVESSYHALSETGSVAVNDTVLALDNRATQEIERLTTDTAMAVADFLYSIDSEVLFAASLPIDEEIYRSYVNTKVRSIINAGEWVLSPDEKSWVPKNAPAKQEKVTSSIEENDNRFKYTPPTPFDYEEIPLFLEMTFLDLKGNEKVKVVTSDLVSPERKDVSQRKNTFIKAETYFSEIQDLEVGEVYVSEVIGEYVGSKIIGRYLPSTAEKVGIPFEPEKSAYAGRENPVGKKFNGLIRWATPVEQNGKKIGYLTLALDHRHVMEFTDRLMPTEERYTELADAYDGNYAFIWDYKGRSIVHPRHFSIVGYDSETGDPQVPWLEEKIYSDWMASGKSYVDFIKDQPTFVEQSNSKRAAKPLTQAGLVGLDCRYLNFAAQCTGWFDLTSKGGSGSFVILWSGLWKLNTAGTIPYYTGRYGESRRGFGFVAIGANVDDFHSPAKETEKELNTLLTETDVSLKTLAKEANESIADNLFDTAVSLAGSTFIMSVLVIFVAVWLASVITKKITYIVKGLTKFQRGERDFRFNTVVKDEIGAVAEAFDEMADYIVAAENDSLIITDLDRKILYVSETGLEYLNTTLDKVRHEDYWDFSIFPPETMYCPITALHEGKEAEVYFHEPVAMFLKGAASYLRTKEGDAIGYIIKASDVTQLVREKENIDKQRAFLDTVFTASPDLIWYKDNENKFIMVNPRFAKIAELAPHDFIGKSVTEVLSNDAAIVFYENDNLAIKAGRAYYSEDSVPFADGHVEVLDVVRTPLYTPSGEYAGLLGVARDVSRRVEVEKTLRNTQRELRSAVHSANAANASKSSFLARMSHEIRTPMNAIIGMSNIASRKLHSLPLPLDELQNHVRQIEVSSQHLLGVINDILDISKIEAGKIELSSEIFSVDEFINSVKTIILPRCDEKNIAFTLHVGEAIPPYLVGDVLRLRQVFINLLGNAVKFTPETGKVSFSIDCIECVNDEAHMRFIINDSGIGMSKEVQEKLFSPFEQGDATITSTYGGTGLGLAISKNIIDLLDGTIEYTSFINEGTTFVINMWLPFEEKEEDAGQLRMDKMDCSGKTILLVDDVELNRMIVVEQLSSLGVIIDEAENGLQAVEMFEASEVGHYAAILMDVQMPVMNGYDASRKVRSLQREDAPTVPIIAMTANAFREDIDEAIGAGMTEHLAKPIEPEKLIALLLRYIGCVIDR